MPTPEIVGTPINLFFRNGSSDKVYNIWVEKYQAGLTTITYTVKVSYGRRGNTLTCINKGTYSTLWSAEAATRELSIEKRRKGYQEVAPARGATARVSVPFTTPVVAAKELGVLPQLLNAVDESKIEMYLKSDDWWMQEKKDGKNILARKNGNSVEIGNRRGLVIPCPSEVHLDLLQLDFNSATVCGELVGTKYFIFDVLEMDGEDLKARPYYYRFNQLDLINDQIRDKDLKNTEVLETYGSSKFKREEFDRLKKAGAEGVVFKKAEAPYSPGRPNSGGDQIKYKFVQTATCEVAAINAKRSVVINLRDGKGKVTVGNVTILPNFEVPKINTLIEVQYLYAYKGGSLYQPVYHGERDDIDKADDIKTLKYKQEESEYEDES